MKKHRKGNGRIKMIEISIEKIMKNAERRKINEEL